MKKIDPYYEWLGIPPKHQPPDHYRLLGLELFEDDRNVIATAADRQMGFVKTYQTGPPEAEELSQRILNELSAARICLLNPKRKDVYDRSLRAELDSKRTESAVSQTKRSVGEDLLEQYRSSDARAPGEPAPGLSTKTSVPRIPDHIGVVRPRPQQAPSSPTNVTDGMLPSLKIGERPLPGRPHISHVSNGNLEGFRIIAIGLGIGCIVLAGLLIVSFAMRSGRSISEDIGLPIFAESSAAIEEVRGVEEPFAVPGPTKSQSGDEACESMANAGSSELGERKHLAEPSEQLPEALPILVLDIEPSLPAVEETLEHAEQRLNLEAAGVLTDSARETFVQEALAIRDRAIIDSRDEVAQRLAELALKVARGSDSAELIQRVTLRLSEVRGATTETLKQKARQRLEHP